MPEVKQATTIYAARFIKRDGSTGLQAEGADRDHPVLVVESVNYHLSTLADDDRSARDVERCELITRTVTEYVDGSEHRSPWVVSA